MKLGKRDKQRQRQRDKEVGGEKPVKNRTLPLSVSGRESVNQRQNCKIQEKDNKACDIELKYNKLNHQGHKINLINR